MFKTSNNKTQKQMNMNHHNNHMFPEINTSSSRYSTVIGAGPENFSQQISSRNHSKFKNTVLKPYKGHKINVNQMQLDFDEEEEND